MTSNKKLTLAIVFTSVFTAGPAFAQVEIGRAHV